MAQDWDIQARGNHCTACQAAFADRQQYYSALRVTAEGYARGDYCAACWPVIEAGGACFSQWGGTYKLPPPKPEETLKKETAESLLRKLIEDEDPARGNVIYILAVMLERKRILVEKDVQARPDGALVRVYEHRKSGETFLIADPRLRLDQLETVQQEVVALLGGGDPAVAPATESAAATKPEPAGEAVTPECQPPPSGA